MTRISAWDAAMIRAAKDAVDGYEAAMRKSNSAEEQPTLQGLALTAISNWEFYKPAETLDEFSKI